MNACKAIPLILLAGLGAWMGANAASADLDVNPPVLVRFDAASSVDVSVPNNPLRVSYRVQDDLSGVSGGYAYAYGPSGQEAIVAFYEQLPGKKLTGLMGASGSWTFLEPGTYTFKSAAVFDAAGNYAFLDEADLAALGRTSFKVKNDRGYDVTPPSLGGGRIVTPRVSVSGHHPGTDQPPIVGITVDLTDSGHSAVAGVRSATAYFYTRDQSRWFVVYGAAARARLAAATLRLAHRIDPVNDSPGQYHLHSLAMQDYGGNLVWLTSQDFGGETDFGLYFPSTTISVKP